MIIKARIKYVRFIHSNTTSAFQLAPIAFICINLVYYEKTIRFHLLCNRLRSSPVEVLLCWSARFRLVFSVFKTHLLRFSDWRSITTVGRHRFSLFYWDSCSNHFWNRNRSLKVDYFWLWLGSVTEFYLFMIFSLCFWRLSAEKDWWRYSDILNDNENTFYVMFGFSWSVGLIIEVFLCGFFDTSMHLLVDDLLIEVAHLTLCQSIHLYVNGRVWLFFVQDYATVRLMLQGLSI